MTHAQLTFADLVERNRSYRRFDGSHAIPVETLRELIGLARLVPSGMNAQPLRYALVCGPETNARVYDTLAWAGALKDWPGPPPAERPTAYIVILSDPELNEHPENDVGIAAQTILLAATDQGLGGCMLGAIRRPALRAALSIPENLQIALVVALGKPVERVILETATPGESVRYYRDSEQGHHVPKRSITEIVVGQFET